MKRWLGWILVAGLMRSFFGIDQLDKLKTITEGCYSWFSSPHYGALLFAVISLFASGFFMGKR
jgi:hypothetical protein